MIQIYFELDIMLTTEYLFAICLKHEYRPTNEVKLYLCSNFSSLWSSQVFKAIDPKQNSSSSAEVQALKNQLHEKEKYIAQIEVKNKQKTMSIEIGIYKHSQI